MCKFKLKIRRRFLTITAMGFWKAFLMAIVGTKSPLILRIEYRGFLQDPVAPAIGENPVDDLGVPVSEYHGMISTVLNKKTAACTWLFPPAACPETT